MSTTNELVVTRGAQGDAFSLESATRTIAHVKLSRDAERSAHLLTACWNVIHRIAARLDVDPLRLAESGAVERMAEFYQHVSTEQLIGDDVIAAALAACRQTEKTP